MNSIKFRMNKRVRYGQAIYFLSNKNNWIADQNSRMTYSKDDIWTLDANIHLSNFEYKYAIGDYDNPKQNHLQWEEGPNRGLNKPQTEKLQVKKDYWGKRQITIKLTQQIPESAAVMMGNLEELREPKMMKKKQTNGASWFQIKQQLGIEKFYENIQVWCCLLVYGKQPKILISKSIIVDQNSNITEDIEFNEHSVQK